MAQKDPWKRYLDAGLELTQMTRDRAERVVRDLVKAGELQREQAQDRVEELLERSRKSTDAIVEIVRTEVTRQLQSLGLIDNRAKAVAKKAASSAKATTKKAASAVKKSTPTAKKKATTKKAASSAKATAKKATSSAKATAKKATGAAKATARKAAGSS